MGGRGGVFTFAKKEQGYWRFASGLILGPGPLHAPLGTLGFLKLLKHGGLEREISRLGTKRTGRSSPGPNSKFLDSCGSSGPFLRSLEEMSR